MHIKYILSVEKKPPQHGCNLNISTQKFTNHEKWCTHTNDHRKQLHNLYAHIVHIDFFKN